jgi:hypothetical protein
MEFDPWECKLDNDLMFGAAASAKAKRVLGWYEQGRPAIFP